ncbi:hypothetical protein ACU4HD_44105 [Cupriavidus basilensis]
MRATILAGVRPGDAVAPSTVTMDSLVAKRGVATRRGPAGPQHRDRSRSRRFTRCAHAAAKAEAKAASAGLTAATAQRLLAGRA